MPCVHQPLIHRHQICECDLKKKRNNGFRFYFSCISSQTIFPYSAIPKSALTRPRTEETWRHGRHHHIKAPGNCILAVVPDNCRLLSLHNSPKPELGLTFKQQVSLTFWKFSYTSRKDLHQSPFSLAERNLKRIFTFIFLKKKGENSIQCLFCSKSLCRRCAQAFLLGATLCTSATSRRSWKLCLWASTLYLHSFCAAIIPF